MKDTNAAYFTITLLSSTNLNVVLAKQASTSLYSGPITLATGTSVTQTVSSGDVYRLLAKATSGNGAFAILIQSPTTGSKNPTGQYNGVYAVAGLIGAYFVIPWIIMFLVMLVLWNRKRRRSFIRPERTINISNQDHNSYGQQYDINRAIQLSLQEQSRNSRMFYPQNNQQQVVQGIPIANQRELQPNSLSPRSYSVSPRSYQAMPQPISVSPQPKVSNQLLFQLDQSNIGKKASDMQLPYVPNNNGRLCKLACLLRTAQNSPRNSTIPEDRDVKTNVQELKYSPRRF